MATDVDQITDAACGNEGTRHSYPAFSTMSGLGKQTSQNDSRSVRMLRAASYSAAISSFFPSTSSRDASYRLRFPKLPATPRRTDQNMIRGQNQRFSKAILRSFTVRSFASEQASEAQSKGNSDLISRENSFTQGNQSCSILDFSRNLKAVESFLFPAKDDFFITLASGDLLENFC